MEATAPKKKRRLTKKQRGFVNDYADTGNATEAVRRNYAPTTELTARAIGSENLTKPHIQEELRKLGFDSNNAKRVISEILNDETLEPKDRIKAAENIFKVHGDYAPDKTGTVNINIDVNARAKELANKLIGLHR